MADTKITTQAVLRVLSDNCYVAANDKIIVAVSGGADSMALLHLLSQLGCDIAAAHCNFQLRGAESDSDEELVMNFCEKNDLKLFQTSFQTKAYAREHAYSIEMAARELRYDWFEELISEEGYNVVATGHHGNDSIETFFLNLVRGTGVKGLSGIQYRNKNVIRPLLDFQRKAVEDYCHQNNISYCHDASNDDTKFIRNKIRHEIVPIFESINPSFFDTMQANMLHMKDAELLLEQEVKRFKEVDLVDEDDKLIIPISKLEYYTQYQSILFEVLKDYGFNSSIVRDVCTHIHGNSGKQFFSSTHRLIKDRHNLFVLPIQSLEVDHFWVEEGFNNEALSIDIKEYAKPVDFSFSRDSSLIHLDAGLIDLPLLVRRWQKGDDLMPLGMKGFKKVSDFFIDEKYSLADKENAWLMLSGEDIIWIVGKRIDDRYKVTNRTKRILQISIK